MPLPGEVTFKRKGEYAPAANDIADETSPNKPVPLMFNQADATTIRNREANRLHEDHDSTPLTFTRRRSSLCPNRRTCIIVSIIGIIILLILILPLALTYGRKSEASDQEGSSADTDKLSGNITLTLSSNNREHNQTFEESIRQPKHASLNQNRRYRRKASQEFSADEEVLLKPLRDLIIETLTAYSPLCSINTCNDASVTDIALDENNVYTRFAVRLTKQLSNLVVDQSMLDELEPLLKRAFPHVYPDYSIEQVETSLDVQSFCAQSKVGCINSTETKSMLLIHDASSNVTMEEAEWRGVKEEVDNVPLLQTSTETSTTSSTSYTTQTSSTASTSTPSSTSTSMMTTSLPTTNAATEFISTVTISVEPTTVSDSVISGLNCSMSKFTCTSGQQQIPANKRCDGVTHCSDGSDEVDCKVCLTSLSCPSLTVGKLCLRGRSLCDNIPNCFDGMDESEQFCKSQCNEGKEFKCGRSKKCIPISLLCDGDAHCSDNEDEIICTSGSKPNYYVSNFVH